MNRPSNAPTHHWVGCILFVSLAAFAPRALGSANDAPLNFVFILADDLGWADLGSYGQRFYETPNLDRLAREGMRFTRAYAASPVCSPTRASILTGRHPAAIGMTNVTGETASPRRLWTPPSLAALPLRETTIAEVLSAAGYATGHVGKWNLGAGNFRPENQGFDLNVGGTAMGSPAGGYFLPNGIELEGAAPGGYLTDHLTSAGIAFMEANRDRPFFLYQSYFSVHVPLQGKEEYVAKYRTKQAQLKKFDYHNPVYAAMIQSLDDGVGRILDTLDELGLTERTVLIFTSDNGGSVYFTKNTPLRAGKGSLYDGGLRVPLLVRYPALVAPASHCDVPVYSPDFVPTLLALAGVEFDPGRATDGVSLVPLLRGAEALERGALFWHYPHYSPSFVSQMTPTSAVRSGRFKLLRFYEGDRTELYDLEADPGESHDLASEQPERVAALRGMLAQWLEGVGALLPLPNPEYDPASERSPVGDGGRLRETGAREREVEE